MQRDDNNTYKDKYLNATKDGNETDEDLKTMTMTKMYWWIVHSVTPDKRFTKLGKYNKQDTTIY